MVYVAGKQYGVLGKCLDTGQIDMGEQDCLAMGSRVKCWEGDRPVWEREETL